MPNQTIYNAFPDLEAVAAQLYTESCPDRPSIREYAAGLEAQGRLTPAVAEAVKKAETMRFHSDCIVYIAGGLTGVSEELKERYGATSQLLKSYGAVADDSETMAFFGYVPHLHGTDPIKHPDVSPQEVRDIDFLWSAITADLHVNFLDPVAHGNAIEEAWGESRLIPTIYLNTDGNVLSRLTRGMHNVAESIHYSEFAESEDPTKKSAMGGLRLAFDELFAWMQHFPGRDPREFFYNGFKRLANPVAVLNGQEPRPGLTITELGERFDLRQFAIYNRGAGDTYGQVGRITDVHEYTGITVTFKSGEARLFDPLSTHVLSFWPIKPGSYLEYDLAQLRPGEIPDPE